MSEQEIQKDTQEYPQKSPRKLNRETSEFIRFAVPDRFPTKQSRTGVHKSEFELDVVFSPVDPESSLPPVRFRRDEYPRVERHSSDKFSRESVMDKPYAIWIGDEAKPYFLNKSSLKVEGKECDEEDYELIKSVIEALKEGVESDDVTVASFRIDNKIDSPTLSKQVLVFEASPK